MLAAPADFKWVQVSRADLGEPGCGHWHSRPRLGPLGMLMGWWRVKVSSGCPLAGRLAAVEQEEAQGKATEASGADRQSAGRAPKPAPRVATPDDRPPAPWGKLPLAELTILAGIVSLIVGIVGQHATAIGIGVALAGLGGMEVAIREHFAGYRSHTTLLAGAVFVFTVGGLFYLADQILAVAPGGRRGRLRDRLLPRAPRIPARLRRPQLPGRRNARLSGFSGGDRFAPAGGAGGELGREQAALARGQRAQLLVLVQRRAAAGTCGRGCGPSGAGWSAARRWSCSRSPTGTRGRPPRGRRLPARSSASAPPARAAPGWLVRVPCMCCGASTGDAIVVAGAVEAASTGTPPFKESVNWVSRFRRGPLAWGPWPGSDRVLQFAYPARGVRREGQAMPCG